MEGRSGHQRVRVEAWGSGTIRVRATMAEAWRPPAEELVLREPCTDGKSATRVTDAGFEVEAGNLTCRVETATGRLSFSRSGADAPLLEEVSGNPQYPFVWPLNRDFTARGGDLWRIEARFVAPAGERFLGLGQHRHGLWDQKGSVVDLFQRNGEINLPLLISDRGYGFLWLQPGVGRVELATNHTRWVAEGAYELDYLVFEGGPAQVLHDYARATGFPSAFPAWAAGFWQSKLRYRNQAEVLGVARKYHERGLPLAVIVVDFMHWEHQGDFDWDHAHWPDPAAMVRDLRAWGVETVVSIWPTAQPRSRNWTTLQDHGLLVGTRRGLEMVHHFTDAGELPDRVDLAYLDMSNGRTAAFLWEQVRSHYVAAGVKGFWLDTCEPEMFFYHHDHLRFSAGPGEAVANRYPFWHQNCFNHGLREAGEAAPLMLCRSAWIGSQRLGAAVWSGDIPSTWEMLAISVRAGLQMALSGIPWWTTDIGGFSGGDPEDPSFRELLLRWFAFGTFCPIMRLHGQREPVDADQLTGSDNEIWSFGSDAETVMTRYLHLRAALVPYILEEMEEVQRSGCPMMRPLVLDYQRERTAWECTDQYLFGRGLLVAPVTERGATSRNVWLPPGEEWTHAWSGERVDGGQIQRVKAPLMEIPVFLRTPWRERLLPLFATPGRT